MTLYEPAELVLTASAGTPIADVEKLLAESGQRFDFEPMDYGPLLGKPAGKGTIGGVLSAVIGVVAVLALFGVLSFAAGVAGFFVPAIRDAT